MKLVLSVNARFDPLPCPNAVPTWTSLGMASRAVTSPTPVSFPQCSIVSWGGRFWKCYVQVEPLRTLILLRKSWRNLRCFEENCVNTSSCRGRSHLLSVSSFTSFLVEDAETPPAHEEKCLQSYEARLACYKPLNDQCLPHRKHTLWPLQRFGNIVYANVIIMPCT